MEGDTEVEKIEIQEQIFINSPVTRVETSLHPNTFSRPLRTVSTSTQTTCLATCVATSSSPETLSKIIPGEPLCHATCVVGSSHLKMFCTPTPTVTTPVQHESHATNVASISQPKTLLRRTSARTTVDSDSSVTSVNLSSYPRTPPTDVPTVPMLTALSSNVTSVAPSTLPKKFSTLITTVPTSRASTSLVPSVTSSLPSKMFSTHITTMATNESQINAATVAPSSHPRTLASSTPDVKTLPPPNGISQCDGADTASEASDNDSLCSDSEDEADSAPIRAVLVPSLEQGPTGAPLRLEVDTSGQARTPSCVPLCALTNPRSGWNKVRNIRTFLRQISPDIMILSEHWGRKKPFEKALASQHFKVLESSRGLKGIPTRGRNGRPAVSVTGGGVALIYKEENFSVEEAGIEPPEGIEAVWAILTPKYKELNSIKKILVGGIYISPRSLHKQEAVEHIIESMHCVQSRYESTIRFIVCGDFNKVGIEDILESNGSLRQICSVATRNSRTLELFITCMATLFHPPTTLKPIEQDENTPGKPSDHNLVVAAPRSDITFSKERQKRKIEIRPRPESKLAEYMRDMGTHTWPEVAHCDDPHEKTANFHKTLIDKLNNHFEVKIVKMSALDKPWFHPALKLKYKEVQKEFFSKGKSEKLRKLKKSFRTSKRKAIRDFYKDFVEELKTSQPGQYYKMAKKIGAVDPNSQGELFIECLEGMNQQEQVQKVADSFAAVSNEYQCVDLSSLPAYLPSEQPPQLEVYKVYKQIQNQKKTKSTLPIDIPESLRKEAAEFLAEPLTDIFNTCLRTGTYPRSWKFEWCTPVPKKKKLLKNLKDVRKIASTSDYSKIFEHFLLEMVLEDISHKLSKKQYGGKKGTGTEHLLVTLIDRIRKLQDDPEKYAVVLNSYDWKGAFDRLDPTEVTLKLIKLGVRSSVISVIIDFLRDRKMQVKMNGHTSTILDLVGGGPQGSIIGQLLYIVGSDDVAEDVPEDDKFKYIDDLSITEAVQTNNKLIQYDVWQHVPSDIATGQSFLPPDTFKSQQYNNQISDWTDRNKMKINEEKSNYIIFSKSNNKFATRLAINGKTLDRQQEINHLGVWISEDLTWDKHITEICKKAYPRVRILSKLKYVGTTTEDLIELYCLLIRSLTEYCSSIFHSSISERLSNKLEAIQKTCLRVILGDMYVSYDAVLEMCALKSLSTRREERSLAFALKCIKHPTNSAMFPMNQSKDTHEVRHRETFKVNKAHTECYKKSSIPHMQRRLNDHFLRQEKLKEARSRAAGARMKGSRG